MCHSYDYGSEHEFDRTTEEESDDEEPMADLKDPEDMELDVELLADGGEEDE
ncbi:MAG: hypothetical protein ABEJ79_04810 [Halolamina sp.]